MINIYNLDYREFFNKLISDNITSELQIHDIPYNVSSNSESSIKFSNRSDMITDFGDWDHEDINFSQFASLCSQLGGDRDRGSSVLVFYNNWYGLSDLVREFKKYYDKVDLLIYHKTNPRPQVRKRNFTVNFEMLIWAHRGNYTFNYKSHKENFASLNIDALYYNSVAMGKDRIKDEFGKTIHPTQKPVKLIQHYI